MRFPAGMPALCLLLAACATAQPRAPELREPTVVIDSANAAWLAQVHRRMTGHPTEPDREAVLCMVGQVRGDTIYIEGFRAPHVITAGPRGTSYFPCPQPDVVGIYHSHPVTELGDGCWHSMADRLAFLQSRFVLAVVSCRRGELRSIAKGLP